MRDIKNYIDVSDFPLVPAIIKNYDAIRKDFYDLKAKFLHTKPNNIMTERQGTSTGKILYKGGFQLVFTRIADASCSKPELDAIYGPTEETRKRAFENFKIKQSLTPNLEQCLAPYLEFVGAVGFNVIHPGAKLNMHYGMCSDYIRIHMGIDCDPGAVFFVENLPPRSWEPRKVFAFSDGDAFHGTEHHGNDPRSILLIDIHKSAFKEFKEELWP